MGEDDRYGTFSFSSFRGDNDDELEVDDEVGDAIPDDDGEYSFGEIGHPLAIDDCFFLIRKARGILLVYIRHLYVCE